MLRFDRKQYNSVEQLSFNKKINKKNTTYQRTELGLGLRKKK